MKPGDQVKIRLPKYTNGTVIEVRQQHRGTKWVKVLTKERGRVWLPVELLLITPRSPHNDPICRVYL